MCKVISRGGNAVNMVPDPPTIPTPSWMVEWSSTKRTRASVSLHAATITSSHKSTSRSMTKVTLSTTIAQSTTCLSFSVTAHLGPSLIPSRSLARQLWQLTIPQPIPVTSFASVQGGRSGWRFQIFAQIESHVVLLETNKEHSLRHTWWHQQHATGPQTFQWKI